MKFKDDTFDKLWRWQATQTESDTYCQCDSTSATMHERSAKQLYLLTVIQQFAFKHKRQTFSRVCLRLKRRVCRWKRECYRGANVAAILGVTIMFWHGKLHTSCILYVPVHVKVCKNKTNNVVLWITKVCNFPCQNMTVTPKISAAFALL